MVRRLGEWNALAGIWPRGPLLQADFTGADHEEVEVSYRLKPGKAGGWQASLVITKGPARRGRKPKVCAVCFGAGSACDCGGVR